MTHWVLVSSPVSRLFTNRLFSRQTGMTSSITSTAKTDGSDSFLSIESYFALFPLVRWEFWQVRMSCIPACIYGWPLKKICGRFDWWFCLRFVMRIITSYPQMYRHELISYSKSYNYPCNLFYLARNIKKFRLGSPQLKLILLYGSVYQILLKSNGLWFSKQNLECMHYNGKHLFQPI